MDDFQILDDIPNTWWYYSGIEEMQQTSEYLKRNVDSTIKRTY